MAGDLRRTFCGADACIIVVQAVENGTHIFTKENPEGNGRDIDIIKNSEYYLNMGILIFQSPKKYKILEIKELLINNDIPILSINLSINVNMSKYSISSGIFYDIRENNGELIVPIEEFNEKLNDNETFEIYTEEDYSEKAKKLINFYCERNFYNDCIFQSNNYNEAVFINKILKENDIPCDEVFTNIFVNGTEEYLIFLDPKYHDQANDLIEKLQVIKKEEENNKSDNLILNDKQTEKSPAHYIKMLIFFIIGVILISIFLKTYIINRNEQNDTVINNNRQEKPINSLSIDNQKENESSIISIFIEYVLNPTLEGTEKTIKLENDEKILLFEPNSIFTIIDKISGKIIKGYRTFFSFQISGQIFLYETDTDQLSNHDSIKINSRKIMANAQITLILINCTKNEVIFEYQKPDEIKGKKILYSISEI